MLGGLSNLPLRDRLLLSVMHLLSPAFTVLYCTVLYILQQALTAAALDYNGTSRERKLSTELGGCGKTDATSCTKHGRGTTRVR